MPAGAGPGGRSGPRSRPRPAIPWPWSSARRRGCRPGSATLRAARCRGTYSGPSARRRRPIRGGTRTAAGRPSRMPRAVCRRPAPPRAARGRSRPARSGRGNRRGGRSSGAQWGTPGMDRRPVLAVLALGVLLRPAPAAAQAWNSDAALALARRAVLRRGGAVADSSLHDYKAQAHGFLFFLGAFGQGLADPPRLVKADQLELEVYWRAPASSKQRVIGWRDQAQLPTDINYHRDHLGIIQNNFGAAMRLGEGDEVRDVPHPLAPVGPDLYDYALGDSTIIAFPQREVRVVGLAVRPKSYDAPRIVGTLYLDAGVQAVAEPVRRGDLERVRAEVQEIAGRRALSGLPPRRLGVRGLSDVVHANRVEGLAVGAGFVWRGGGEARELRSLASYGTSDDRPKGEVTVTERRGRSARGARARGSPCGATSPSRPRWKAAGLTGPEGRMRGPRPAGVRSCRCGPRGCLRAPSSASPARRCRRIARSCSAVAARCSVKHFARGAAAAWRCSTSNGACPCPSARSRWARGRARPIA